jgi:hypothetical protein
VALPFTKDQFFEVFARYNTQVWPAQWLLLAVGLAAVGVLFTKASSRERVASAAIGLLWIWVGAIYHLGYFTTINPAAYVFGVLSIAEGLLFVWSAGADKLHLSWMGPSKWVGGALATYSLAIYPLLNVVLGHEFPAVPTFGLPCPTTILTLGLLWWLRGQFTRVLAGIPILWSGIGGSAAFSLGVPQDLGLLVAGLVSLYLLRRRVSHPEEASRE